MNYQLFGYFMLINYIIDQINGQISRSMVEKVDKYVNIFICGIITSSNFWFLSNLGVFFTDGNFTSHAFRNIFYKGLPFYKFNLFSTLIFNIFIYGAHNLFTHLKNKRENKKTYEQARLILNESDNDVSA